MAFVDRLLDVPSYGYCRGPEFYRPSRAEILREFGLRLSPTDPQNWLSIAVVGVTLVLLSSFGLFLTFFFTWPLFVVVLLYTLIVLSSHANFWIHRYCTHKAFRFRNSLVRTLARNLVIKAVPEEIHVISHHVHHHLSEQPGDPYNVHGGLLYCFLADINHQGINKKLSERDYATLCRLLGDTGIRLNTFRQYKYWGSLCHPLIATGHYLLNWIFWFAVFYTIGGLPLATALFGATGLWTLAYRTFNYNSHGGGLDRRETGVDFNWKDFSINKKFPGIITGEWHNNHHLYPTSARSGFLPWQLDLPWLAIRAFHGLGLIKSYQDSKNSFYRDHWDPYLKSQSKISEFAIGNERKSSKSYFGSLIKDFKIQ